MIVTAITTAAETSEMGERQDSKTVLAFVSVIRQRAMNEVHCD